MVTDIPDETGAGHDGLKKNQGNLFLALAKANQLVNSSRS
jgi:hypothetical protein